MTTTTPYTEVAAAAGAWSCPVTLPAAPLGDVAAVLAALARTQDWPVNAFAYGADGEPVTELHLYRDPSRTHGTPAVARCDEAVQALTATTGWTSRPERAPRTGILVGLGLLEGYDPDARQHDPAEVTERLATAGGEWTVRPARLLSARLIGADVRGHQEDAVVVHSDGALVPVITALAHGFAQDRFVITNFGTGCTRAFARKTTA